MNWHDIAFPSDASLVCKHSAEMLGMEDVYEMDTDISYDWKEVDQDFETDVLVSDYQTYDEETASLMLLDDETLMYVFDDTPYVPESTSDHEDAWDEEWFWSQRESHVNTWIALKQRMWERTHTPKPKFVRPTIAIVPKPQPVVITVAATTVKEVEPVPEIKQPQFDPKCTFTFRSGVVISIDFTNGEYMHKSNEYRKVFNAKSVQSYLDQGYQFECKHEVLFRPQ